MSVVYPLPPSETKSSTHKRVLTTSYDGLPHRKRHCGLPRLPQITQQPPLPQQTRRHLVTIANLTTPQIPPTNPKPTTTDPPSTPSSITTKTTDAPPSPSDKFTKSRAVGQSHRDNERHHMTALRHAVAEGRAENVLLFALFHHRVTTPPSRPPHSRAPHSHLPPDCAEDAHLRTDDVAHAAGLHRLSAPSAAAIGQTFISPALAAVLLELAVCRRNLVADTAERRKHRRRTSYRLATTQRQADAICQFALRALGALTAHLPPGHARAVVDSRLGALGIMFRRFDQLELVCNPAGLRRSPAPEADVHVGERRRRGEGAKRCSRCRKLKVSGSGHGRSKCDDGFSISSVVPYPASPTPDEAQSC